MKDRTLDRLPESSTGRGRPGFTLIELTLTLSIIATLSAIALPRYLHSADRYHTEAAARRIIADLRFARDEAMQTSVATTVRFDVANNDYVLEGVPDPDHGNVPYTIALDRAPYRSIFVSAVLDRAGASDALDEVVFDVYGRPDSDGTVVISSGASTRTVVLDPETGKASMP